ncbi:sigma factor-like helix-turn-helix DNA-binding protein [Eubacterium sp.]|uniref:sigma factor-like helix-turn-helix DNA-binding protein n=1 Tax=Eubacterium sp. TaxID=142586 RepID=UPI0026E0C65A|nr:sigma factor-like helix-turn-helix DNA-binding protein [Eubacterium sp.]MDO5434476.1 sigma factor-like helix-turn-helix DNA-binding protein [Eubacterium sp.]
MRRKPGEFKLMATCFIKEHAKYRKITYGELKRMRERDPDSFSNRWFIPIDGMLLEVNQQEYKEFYRSKERQDYLEDLDKEYRAVSYETLKEQSYQEKDLINIKEVDIHKIVETGLLIKELRKALSQLNQDEFALIKAIYFDDKTVKDLSKNRGISINAAYKQKQRVLKKLKKMIEG